MSELYCSNDLKRCLLISAVVGTILVSINQGPAFFVARQGGPDTLVRVLMNYIVPFSVASMSAIMANRAHLRECLPRR